MNQGYPDDLPEYDIPVLEDGRLAGMQEGVYGIPDPVIHSTHLTNGTGMPKIGSGMLIFQAFQHLVLEHKNLIPWEENFYPMRYQAITLGRLN